MGDQAAPQPAPPPSTPSAPSTVPAGRPQTPEGKAPAGSGSPHPKLLERELFGWVVFAVIVIVAIAAAWGTYIVLRQ